MVVVVLLMTAGWGGLSARLIYLHLGPTDRWREWADEIHTFEREIQASRGRIMDRGGKTLAQDLPEKHVVAAPVVILSNQQVRLMVDLLARELDLDPAVVCARLQRPNRRHEYIRKFVPDDVASRLRRMQLKGVFFEDVSARYYPKESLMAHVVGFSNLEGVGSAGTELRWNSYLRGLPGWREGIRDGLGRELVERRMEDIAPQPGADVYLTLDENIQYMVEKALDAAVQNNQAQGAWAIVERVQTGEILALANRPTYNPNEYRMAAPDLMMNRAIGYMYEPGSTFKLAVIAAALNEGTVCPDDVFDCENGVWYYRGRPLHDYHPYGNLMVKDIVKKSSNIGAAKVALTLGDARLEHYLRAFGCGQPTGIDLPGEATGILHPRTRWNALSLSRIAMGHEVSVTALQMLNIACCIANRGFLMRPRVVRRIVNAQGKSIVEFTPEVLARPIREDTARLMTRLLARVTEEGGTGYRARVAGYTIAGKTGTAQKPVPGGYSSSANIASFVGFLPAEEPEIAMIVVVDEPQPDHTGGLVAAPVFQEVAAQLVRYLDIPPNAPDGKVAPNTPMYAGD